MKLTERDNSLGGSSSIRAAVRALGCLAVVGLGLACGRFDSERETEQADPTPLSEYTTGSTTGGLRSGSRSYWLRPDGPGWATTIDFLYHNAGRDTVYVVNCNGTILMHLQKRDSGEWTDAWYAEGDQCLSTPIVVSPGETLRGGVEIWGAEPGNPAYNTFKTAELDGEYRLAWPQPVHHYNPTASHFGDTIPSADRVSNPFELRTTKD